MQLGIVGLGRMGAFMAERLVRSGHTIIGYVRHAERIEELLKELPVEKRLEGIPTEKRLEGISAEERVKGLSAEERAALLRLLQAQEKGDPSE